jgi:hypothetical protein
VGGRSLGDERRDVFALPTRRQRAAMITKDASKSRPENVRFRTAVADGRNLPGLRDRNS